MRSIEYIRARNYAKPSKWGVEWARSYAKPSKWGVYSTLEQGVTLNQVNEECRVH